jgi:4-carboxymuconolactone decarboxylase
MIVRRHDTRRRLAVLMVVMGCLAVRMAGAQDRMPPIPSERMTPAQKDAVAEFKAARGVDITGPFVPLLRSPELVNPTRALGDYLRFKPALPLRLSEFIILITAREWTQQYLWGVHYPAAIQAGLSPEIARAVAEGRRPVQMADDEALVYDLCAEVQRNHGVSDAVYARALSAFGEKGVLDAVSILGFYTFLAVPLNTARTPARGQGNDVPPLPSLP